VSERDEITTSQKTPKSILVYRARIREHVMTSVTIAVAHTED